MGGVTLSKQQSLTNILNSTTLSVMNSVQSQTTTSSNQQNTVSADGPGSRNVGITLSNKLNGEVVALISASASGTLQQKLISELSNQLAQASSTIGLSASSSSVETNVTNAVNLAVSQTLVSELKTIYEQTNKVTATNGGENINVVLSNFADLKTKVTQQISAAIISELKNDATVKNELDQKVSNPLTDIFGNPINMSIIVVVLLVAAAGFIFFKYGKSASKPANGPDGPTSGGRGDISDLFDINDIAG
jgi:hypothetical protein